MHGTTATGFHSAPSYFSLPAKSPSIATSSHLTHTSTPRMDSRSPTDGSTGFAEALAKQLNQAAPAPTPIRGPSTPTGSAKHQQPYRNLTPRKRSPPSNGETPPHQRADFFGSASTATPGVSRLSLKADYPAATTNSTMNFSLMNDHRVLQPQFQLPNKPFQMSLPQLSGPKPSASQVHSDRFKPILPAELCSLLDSSEDDAVLVLDLRPHSAFSLSETGRLARSINLCVPSTLLRRPNYKIAKVADSVADSEERARVLDATADSKSGELTHLIAMDQNSTSLAADSPIHSLLLKYDVEGFKGALQWVQGGFQALAADPNFQRHLEKGPRAPSTSSTDGSPPSSQSSGFLSASSGSKSSLFGSSWSSSRSSLASIPDSSGNQTLTFSASPQAMETKPLSLRGQALPRSAFDGRSTQNYISGVTSELQAVRLIFVLPSCEADLALPPPTQDNGRNARVSANPFFDSIRQNTDRLSLKRSMANLTPIVYRFEEELKAKVDLLPPFLQSFAKLSPQKRAERLAREFHDLELMEQKRMQKLMDWHANVQTQTAGASNPLSISAGVEMGHLNRYRHIFPVRLFSFTRFECTLT
jgi:hypothetical protein